MDDAGEIAALRRPADQESGDGDSRRASRPGGSTWLWSIEAVHDNVDYARKTAFFEPNASFDQPYEFDHAGFVLGAGGTDFSTLTVFMVIAGTPASAAGIQTGDEILTINGRPARAFTLDEAREYFEHAVGLQKLTIRRNGSIMSLTVECHSIV